MPVLGTAFAFEARATHVGLALDSVTRAFVDELKAANLNVFIYTANDSADIEWCKTLGVDGIISDRPDCI